MATTRSKEIRSGAQACPVQEMNKPKKPAMLEVVKLPFRHNSKDELDGPKNPHGGTRTCTQTPVAGVPY